MDEYDKLVMEKYRPKVSEYKRAEL